MLLILILFVSATSFSAETVFRVNGTSMQPTLKPGDLIQVDEGYFDNHLLVRGGLVAIQFKTQATPLIKRVVAVAGDLVQIVDEEMVVAGKRYQMPKRGGEILAIQLSRYEWQVPPNHFIALGDNPRVSFDSTGFGLLSRKQVMGRIRLLKRVKHQ